MTEKEILMPHEAVEAFLHGDRVFYDIDHVHDDKRVEGAELSSGSTFGLLLSPNVTLYKVGE